MALSGLGCATKATKAECEEGCSNVAQIMVHEAELLTRNDPELKGEQNQKIALDMVEGLAETTKTDCMRQCAKKGSRQKVKCLAKAKSSDDLELCR